MPESASRLPARPSLEQLRKQAKELLRATRAGDADALRRVATVKARVPESEIPRAITLVDAQWVVAREHGFESWPRLVESIESARPEGIGRFERVADLIARAYMDGDAAAIRDFNGTHNTSFIWDDDLERMRRRLTTWYASESRSMDLAVADARHLVARQAGVDSWEDLVDQLAAAARGARSGVRVHSAQTALYRVDDSEQAIQVRGPLVEADWDTVFAIMRERRLTILRGAGRISDAALERLARLDHVTSVDLSFATAVTPAGLRHLSRLPLDHLELGGWGTCIDDAGLEVLRHLPLLRTVSLVWAQRISDAGVAHLAGCEHLRSVNLMGTPTGDGALRALAGKPQLAAVDAGTRVTTAGLELLRDFPIFANALPEAIVLRARATDGEPSHLSLHPRTFVTGGLDAVARLSGLFSLRFFSMNAGVAPIERRALEPLAGMTSLESLWCNPSDAAMTVVARMPRLRKLTCQDTRASDDGWVALSESSSIETIWGGRNGELGGRGFRALANMPSLRSLAVDLGRVPDDDLAVLPTFPALRALTPVGLVDAGFRHVGRCAELEALTCMYTKGMGDGATSYLADLHRLRTYYAGDTTITDRSLATLATLPSLESVELWDCPGITNAGLALLAAAPSLREVTVEGAPGVTRAAAALFPARVRVRVSC